MNKTFSASLYGEGSQSVLVVGESRTMVKEALEDFKSRNIDKFILIDDGDTLVYSMQIMEEPLKVLLVSNNDRIVYQEINSYCSSCTDKMIDEILNDTRYKFEAVDQVNYKSTKDLNVVMRLKDAIENEQSCRSIKVFLL